MKLKAVIAVSVLAIAAATGGWMYYRYESAPKNLELYGNVDIRQVNLAFLWPERIKSILVEEGDFVKAGQPVAEQETDTLKIEIEQAKAAEQAAYQTYLGLKNGSRPEDIAKAEAAVLVAQSRLHLAQKDFERVDGIFKSTKGQGKASTPKAASCRSPRTNCSLPKRAWNLQRSVLAPKMLPGPMHNGSRQKRKLPN